MKLASLRHGRDGRLVVVSRDLKRAAFADSIAPTLQAALDNWAAAEPRLRGLSDELNAGRVPNAAAFDAGHCAAPLPRAYQWADGSAYLNHVELVRKARGAEMPPSFLSDPLMYQGASDSFVGPCEDILAADEAYGIDFEAEIAAVTDDVPMGISAQAAEKHVKLLMLVNDVSLRNLIPAELAKGFGFFQSKPATAFSPVAATPDELGQAWRGGKLHGTLRVEYRGKVFGATDPGEDMNFSFFDLIAHAAKTRELEAGTIVGSGTVSNRDRTKGSSCLAEVRTIETIEKGKPETPFMKFGDTVRIEFLDTKGASVFGAIAQKVARYEGPRE